MAALASPGALQPNTRGLVRSLWIGGETEIEIVRPLRDFLQGAEVFVQTDAVVDGFNIWRRCVIVGRHSKRRPARVIPIERDSIELVVKRGDSHWLARCVPVWFQKGEAAEVGTVRVPQEAGVQRVSLADLQGVPASARRPGTIEGLARSYRAGKRLPPIEVFLTVDGLIGLYDGNHRLLAARAAQVQSVDVRWTLPEAPSPLGRGAMSQSEIAAGDVVLMANASEFNVSYAGVSGRPVVRTGPKNVVVDTIYAPRPDFHRHMEIAVPRAHVTGIIRRGIVYPVGR